MRSRTVKEEKYFSIFYLLLSVVSACDTARRSKLTENVHHYPIRTQVKSSQVYFTNMLNESRHRGKRRKTLRSPTVYCVSCIEASRRL